MNYKEFARRVKEKYPDYADMSDLDLAKAMVAKFPEEYSDITFDEDGGTPQSGMLPVQESSSRGVLDELAPRGPVVPFSVAGPTATQVLAEGSPKQATNISKYSESVPMGQVFPNLARRLNALDVSSEGVMRDEPTRPLGEPGALLDPVAEDILGLPGRLMVVVSDPSESLNKTSADYLSEGKVLKSILTDPTLALPGAQAKGALPVLSSDGLAAARKIYPLQKFSDAAGEMVGIIKQGVSERLPTVVPFASKKVLGGAAEGAALADLSADVTAHQDATPGQIGIGSALGALSGILGAAGPILKFGSDSPYLASKEAYQLAVDPLARQSALSNLERTASEASGIMHNLPEFSNEYAGKVYQVYADEAGRLKKLFERGKITKDELTKKMAPMESMLEGIGFAGSEVDAEQMIRYAKRLSQTNPSASKDLMKLASEKIAEVRSSGRLGQLSMPKQARVSSSEQAIQLLTAPTKSGKAATVVPLIDYLSAPVREGLLGPAPRTIVPFIPEEDNVGPQSSLIEIPEGDYLPVQGIRKYA